MSTIGAKTMRSKKIGIKRPRSGGPIPVANTIFDEINKIIIVSGDFKFILDSDLTHNV